MIYVMSVVERLDQVMGGALEYAADPLHDRRVRPLPRRLIFAVTAGNALEWYDIAIYGYFILYISKAFFPPDASVAPLLLALGTFAASFLARPIGAILFGHIADRHGRRTTTQLTLLLMMVGTALIVFAPPYTSIGLAATTIVLLGRVLQGLSAGGEFGSSTALLAEIDETRRGELASWQYTSQSICVIMASAVGLALTTTFDRQELEDGWWRLAFLPGLLVGPAAMLLRRSLAVSDRVPDRVAMPIRVVLATHKSALAICIGLVAISTAVNWFLVYIPTLAVTELKLPAWTGFACTLLGGTIMALLTPSAGRLSDRHGATGFMRTAVWLKLASLLPAFWLLHAIPSLLFTLIVVVWFSLLKVLYFGPLAGLMAGLYPAAVRATGLALSYNIGVVVFGGTAPLMLATIRHATGSATAQAVYMMGIATLSLIAVEFARRLMLRRGTVG